MNNNPNETPSPTSTTSASTPQPNTIPVNSLAPDIRPMEQAAPVEPTPQKKKLGPIIGIVSALVLLICGGVVAAVVLLNTNKPDPVAAAMNKIMNGNAPYNVAIDGNIDINVGYQSSPISNIRISLNSSLIPSSLINTSAAEATITIRNVGDFTVEFDELYAADGDLYFKLDGATNALEDSGILYLLHLANNLPKEIDCGEDEYCQTEEISEQLNCVGSPDMNCGDSNISTLEGQILGSGGQLILDEDTISFFNDIIDAIELIDGEWLRVSTDEFNSIANKTLKQSDTSCIVNLVSSINSNSNSASELYKKYPFITSSTEGVDLVSKQYPVYRIGINSENFANFVNSIQNPAISEEIYSCLNLENNIKIDEQDAANIAAELPVIYAEIDNDDNFSRLYLTTILTENDDYNCACPDDAICDCLPPAETKITIDLGFSYPNNTNVSEPLEYMDYSDFIKNISSSFFELPQSTDNPPTD